jgi:predicted nucleic acid-binding protein
MADWQRQCWDSALFISYLTGHESERVKRIDALLDQFDRSGIHIVVSTFAIAEVRRLPERGIEGPSLGNEQDVCVEPFDASRLQRIQDIFRSPDLDVRVLTPRIAERAASIGDMFPKLLPADCVHIATAIEAKVDVLFTYDGVGQRRRPDAMLRYDGRIDGLRIKEPFVPLGPLFDPDS